MNRNKISSFFCYVSSICYYGLAIMEFIDSTDRSMGVFWLCLGSAMLCLGSMFLNKYKNSEENHETEIIEGPRKKLIILIIIFLIAFLFILATFIVSTLLS